MHLKTGLLFLLLSLCTIGTLQAQGFYVGASIGSSFANKKLTGITGEDFKISKSGFAWKAYGGISWKFLGIEGGYRDLGTLKDAETIMDGNGDMINVEGESRTRGGDIFAKGTLKIAIIQVFAKAGGFFRRTDRSLFDVDSGEDLLDEGRDRIRNTVFAWGVGAGVNLGLVGLRVEWESLEINPDDLSMLTVGATIGLGK